MKVLILSVSFIVYANIIKKSPCACTESDIFSYICHIKEYFLQPRLGN